MFNESITFFESHGYMLTGNDGYQQDLVNGDDIITIMKIEGDVVCNRYKHLDNDKYRFISETHIGNKQELQNILNG